LLPVLTFAQPGPQQDLGYIGNAVNQIGNVINLLFPVVTGAAVLGFFIGLAKYIFQAGNEDAQDQGKQIMIAGVVALFFIVAIGGIVNVLATSLGVDTGVIDPGNPVPGL